MVPVWPQAGLGLKETGEKQEAGVWELAAGWGASGLPGAKRG